MLSLDTIAPATSVFVIAFEGVRDDRKHLNSLGISANNVLTVVKNPSVQSPMMVEVDNIRFALSKKLARKILVSHVLDDQTLIFEGNQTRQREVVLNILKDEKGHFTLESLLERAQKADPKIGQITIYRTLKAMVDRGVLEELSLPDGARAFEVKKGHHDHIICEGCGEIFEFHNEMIEKLQEDMAALYGIKLKRHSLKLIGETCKKCAPKN